MKNNILKVFAVLLAVMLIFVLASCGKDNEKDKVDTTDTSSLSETKQEETTGSTESTEKKDTESELTTGNDDQAPTVTAGAETNAKDGSAKPGGKDPGKDPGKTDDEKQTGQNTSETSKPTGGKAEETTSASEPEEKDSEGEFISSKVIHLPIVNPNL